MKKRLLVLVENYPNEDSKALMYVHVRNKYYLKNDFAVDVLSFNAKANYTYDGINVLTLDFFKKSKKKYDYLVSHASNLRNHYKFIKKNHKNFDKIFLFHHGHEILKISQEYPKEYPWIKNKAPIIVRNIYDEIKFKLWKILIIRIINKTELIFVSNWLFHRFIYNIHINPKLLEGKIHIINNSVGEIFENENYEKNSKKEFDVITIRGGGLDGSKYGIDLVTKLAILNPQLKFLVIGKGKFYDHVKKPQNITFINKSLDHKEMIEYLNKSKSALLLTKEDTQGVMTCEMFTFGIPTITSDIEVCREIFGGIDNVELIDNNNLEKIDLEKIINSMFKKTYTKNEKYFVKNTIKKEVELFRR